MGGFFTGFFLALEKSRSDAGSPLLALTASVGTTLFDSCCSVARRSGFDVALAEASCWAVMAGSKARAMRSGLFSYLRHPGCRDGVRYLRDDLRV